MPKPKVDDIRPKPTPTGPKQPASVPASQRTFAASPDTSPQMTPLQEELASLLGDLILNGGHRQDVRSMFYAAFSHYWRRRFTEGSTPDKYVENNEEKWARKLAAAWPTKDKIEWPPIASGTVTDYIRANYRGSLDGRIERFLEEATAEEIRFLDAVAATEIQLANSFEAEIDREITWVRIPRKHQHKVIVFIELLAEEPTPA